MSEISSRSEEAVNITLSDETQRQARIEQLREKAKAIRAGKLVCHPEAEKKVIDNESSTGKQLANAVKKPKNLDSGGGFFLVEDKSEEVSTKVVEPPTVTHPITYETCIECKEEFLDSFLMTSFNHSVCDKCRDNDEKHSLITRTDAKKDYLLKDCDFDKREPPLKYISRKNPHNERWGEMKLYLHLQVEQRALEIFGSEESLEKEHEIREWKRYKTKKAMMNNKNKKLKMDVRSSLFDRTSEAAHTHSFGPESYDEAADEYTHKCIECGLIETYEKM